MQQSPTPAGATTLLLDLLEDLTEKQFKKFKLCLAAYPVKAGDSKIPRMHLDTDCRMDIAVRMTAHCGDRHALEMAADLLLKIPRLDLLEVFQGAAQAYLGEKRPLPEADTKGKYPRTKYKEYIKKRFRGIKFENRRIGEHVTLKTMYTKLIILKNYRPQEEKKHEIIYTGTRHQKLIARQAEHSFSSIEALLAPAEDGHVPSTVVLQGVAGIGKTMTARKIMLDWASGELFQDRFEYVFYIHCREHNLLSGEKTIEDLIMHSCEGRPLVSMREIEADPQKLLFIVDGFDELSIPKELMLNEPDKDSEMDKTLVGLIWKRYLSESHIIITTRPTAMETLTKCLTQCVRDERFAEILGFSEGEKKEYFTKYFGNEECGIKAYNIVKENEILSTMCFVPIICWIVCNVIRQQMEMNEDFEYVLRTNTSVYMSFLSNLIKKQSPDSVQPIVTMNLKRLCALAKEGIYQQKILFKDSDIAGFALDIPAIQSLFLKNDVFMKNDENYNVYSFIHLSFQEFFAALFYVLGEDEADSAPREDPLRDVISLLEDYGKFDHLVLTVRYLFGLLNKDRLHQMERRFGWKISPDIKPALQRWIKDKIKQSGSNISHQMSLLHCLYEIQDEEFVTRTTESWKHITLSLSRRLNAMEYKALAFCINSAPGVQQIDLSRYQLELEDLRTLLPCLMKCESLKMYLCSLTGSCCAEFASLLRTNTTLTQLDLSWNELLDSGVRKLCEGLNHPGCKIHTLKLAVCSLTASCCPDLSALLRNNSSLTELDLSRNKLQDSGMRKLCEGLKRPGCKIQTLRMECCSLSASCCAHLSSVLRTNTTLTELNLNYNELRDSGLRELCEGLKHPFCKIQTLMLWGCSLTGSCCADLSSVLRRNTALTQLYLSYNKLGDSGVRELCKGLKNPNSKIQTLGLRWAALSDDCTEDLCSALSTNQSFQSLDVLGNDFTPRSETCFDKLKETLPSLELRIKYKEIIKVEETREKKCIIF